ncbi:uncharacterized protein LACBIDRAFT_326643 [Laccaria bicolor S238N-H82]|uniref:Predicted protein n=1 Tax=Laccaria bicolor (strain S238N-H82 / ATCC MYA-4686) TaxID=486041 RepID=B0D9B6_LACBS|nr:uncharacterized protein LACBIDRAFT_326643 [Laccaria bicolor S238N-H82]EDR09219.1 predicted protein [Laccaria bicolor S238N-H82]|eukprot:XP_001880532.1 predicted protein [Laccaria bicolor S238N-H82]
MYDEDDAFMDEYQTTRITITDHRPSSQITNIMATIHDSMQHLTLVEEAVVSAPNFEDMLVRMTLMATMAEETKGSLGMALAGLDAGIRRMAMKSDSQMVACYVDDTLVRAVDSEGSSTEEEEF